MWFLKALSIERYSYLETFFTMLTVVFLTHVSWGVLFELLIILLASTVAVGLNILITAYVESKESQSK